MLDQSTKDMLNWYRAGGRWYGSSVWLIPSQHIPLKNMVLVVAVAAAVVVVVILYYRASNLMKLS